MTLDYLPWTRPAAYSDRPCVRDERVELTYAEFAERVEGAAEQLAERGVGTGSVVAIMLPNRVELLVAMMAAWRLGAAATPVNPTFTANEAEYQIADADATVVVVGQDGAPTAGRPALLADQLRLRPEGAPGAVPAPATRASDLALLIYTSGSTGRPKGVMLSHANIDAMTASMGEALRVTPDDHCLLVLPLFHVNAICVSVLTPLRNGAQVSLLERFHPTGFLEQVARLRPTYFSAVPTIYQVLVSLPAEVEADTSSVRVGICGAAPAPADLLAAVESRFGFPVVEGYGLSEGTCASTANPVDGPRKAGTVGIALPGQTVAVMDPDGNLLPAGERGEVVIQGPTVMQGYLNNPSATAEVLGDGWLHTGDVGVLDEDGYLTIVDRIKDMIIRGGENIYPKEIEAVLYAHPVVLEAAVVGAPDATYGEIPVAYVSARPGTEVGEDELRAHCAEQLTKVKVPARIHLLAEIPKNPVGKIDKPRLRAQMAEA
ncbi:acyl-CoA synthetase (AMP-forming)/AMP-acid ligase II [Nocardioides sp. J9]|uniref:class I adenylate-forming enzyme family protein n=1 Tax=Nocardioides sp. J9 TaxID=935844 RepID=UPI00119CC96C|nr:AMP-binding protein [Nocardioides sp. J9]TWG91541.1 acyl-CoA synthetase (AMP-forming)/AMP-acid ligase II [Nocardioides sp. J9]